MNAFVVLVPGEDDVDKAIDLQKKLKATAPVIAVCHNKVKTPENVQKLNAFRGRIRWAGGDFPEKDPARLNSLLTFSVMTHSSTYSKLAVLRAGESIPEPADKIFKDMDKQSFIYVDDIDKDVSKWSYLGINGISAARQRWIKAMKEVNNDKASCWKDTKKVFDCLFSEKWENIKIEKEKRRSVNGQSARN